MKKSIRYIFALVILFTSCKKDEKSIKVESTSSNTVVYYNGDIITMEGKEATYAEALVIKDGKILFVGEKDEAIKQAGENHSIIDLKGKTLLPAFLDGHGHFYNVGFTGSIANILPPPDGSAKDFESIISIMKTYKDSEEGKLMIKKFGWIMGNGYDDSQLKEKDHPKATDLDKISTEIPVIIIHQSGHLAAINTKAMQMLGLAKATKNPSGGTYRRNSDGSPNGVLEENTLFRSPLKTLQFV